MRPQQLWFTTARRCCDAASPTAVSMKAVPISDVHDRGEELFRRNSNCLAHTGEPSTLRAAPKYKSEAIVTLTAMWREAGSHFQLKSGGTCSVNPFIHTHSLSHSPPSSAEKVNATSFVFLKISFVNIMRPLTVISSQHPTMILTIQQHPQRSKELENTSSAENTNINVQNKHIWCIRTATKSLQRLQGNHLFAGESKPGGHNELVRHCSASWDSEGN